jgi:hypothetical protein
MKRTISAFVLFLLVAGLNFAVAQNRATIKFDSLEHNFGTFNEEQGNVSYNFNFKNTGDAPLIVSYVRSSCGCTTPEWTREPVAPGGKGFIRVTYNPRNRPGNFTKTISISSNATNPMVVLKINGKVIPRVKTPEELYPREVGLISMRTNHLAFVQIKDDEVRTDSLEFINLGDKPVSIGIKQAPSYLKVNVEPETVQPGKKGHFVITYDATKKKEYGFVIDRVYLTENGESNYNYSIGVSATIVEDFSKLTPQQLANAPKVNFDERVFNFGEISEGQKVDHVFKITNTGKENLIIRRVRASCGCTAVTPAKTVIEPGNSTELKVEFNSRGKRGRQNKSITVITNDPDQPTTILRVTGNVKS